MPTGPRQRSLGILRGVKKQLLLVICGAIVLGLAAFVGDGYLKGRRAEHKAAAQRDTVHSLTQQELARAVARCDAWQDPGRPPGSGAAPNAKYCEDVAREMDDRPLEIVKQKPPVLPH